MKNYKPDGLDRMLEIEKGTRNYPAALAFVAIARGIGELWHATFCIVLFVILFAIVVSLLNGSLFPALINMPAFVWCCVLGFIGRGIYEFFQKPQPLQSDDE
jgi:Na+/glutamate symporter